MVAKRQSQILMEALRSAVPIPTEKPWQDFEHALDGAEVSLIPVLRKENLSLRNPSLPVVREVLSACSGKEQAHGPYEREKRRTPSTFTPRPNFPC